MSAPTPQATADDTIASAVSRWRSPRRRPTRVFLGVLVIVVVVAGVVLAVTKPFSANGQPGGGVVDNASRTATATVTQRDLSSQTNVNGTLGYSGSYTAVNQAQGTITALPAVGQVITQGQVLYQVSGNPIVLLYGSTPAYRSLSAGVTGADVAQLNADLGALGYASSSQLDPTSNVFSSATVTALDKLQAGLGVRQTGSLDLGQAVFLPCAVRITAVSATLGASAGGPVLTASSTTRAVTIALNAAQQSQVKAGAQVTITLPDTKTTPGVVWAVGSVAITPSGGGTPTVGVVVIPTDPAATGSLDQAPVQVSIITATAKDALVVPANALLAVAGSGYAVEIVDGRGVHHLVPVTLGLFDDAEGLVQVTGSGVAAGQRVVVPST